MRIRDSGMAEEAVWESFFEPASILSKLGLCATCGDLAEFGCGYGTFTIPAARIVSGTVYALDIEAEMIETTRGRAEKEGLENVRVVHRDFVVAGTGRPDRSADYAMVFNILHHENPVALLREAHRNLRPGGLVGIIHWIHDASTPRGPDLATRPRPEQCRRWAEEAGFARLDYNIVDLPPYHYGLVLARPD